MKKNTFILCSSLLLVVLLTGRLIAAEAQPGLQKIKYSKVSASVEQVILQLNGSYSPKTFTLKDQTPRIIFDFPNMTYGREIQGSTTTNGSIVKRIRVGMHAADSPKTRVVVDVATLQGLTFTQKFDEKSSSLVIQFTSSIKSKSPASVAPRSPAQEKDTVNGEKGGDKVAAKEETASAQTSAEIKPESKPVEETEAKPSVESPAKPEPPVKTVSDTPPLGTVAAPDETRTPASAHLQTHNEAASPEKTTTKPETPSKVEAAPQLNPIPAAIQPPAKPVDTAKAGEKSDSSSSLQYKDAGAAASTSPEKTEPLPQAETKPTSGPEKPTAQPDEVAAKIKSATQSPTVTTNAALPPTPKPAAAKNADEGTAANKTASPLRAETGPRLESVQFDGTSSKGEMIKFKLNGFHPPAIHGVEEGIPRVICDFNNTQLTDATKNLIKTDGKYIKVIRISKTKKPERVRVILDLEPNRSYDLQQVFFKEDNLFVIIVNTMKK